jgi:acid phosphatase (class A)
MMRIRSAVVSTVLIAAALLAAGAGGSLLISSDAIDVARLLPDPPTRGSDEAVAEMQQMLALQATRTPADVARTKNEAGLRIDLFANVLGPWFNAQNCPRTFNLLTKVGRTASHFSTVGKDHWNRPRPAMEFPALQPSIPTPDNPAYPSGHSTVAMAWAEVLADLIPDKRDALMERGREIGWDRVIAGVHYPSDVLDGRVLGHVVAVDILASPDYSALAPDARAELQQAEDAAR